MASQDSALQLPAPATKPGETPTKRTITDTTFTQPVRVGDLKVGAFAMLRDRPCKITSVTHCEPGKHGHAKANFVGVDLFSGKKVHDAGHPTNHTMRMPIVATSTFTLMDIDESDVSEEGFPLASLQAEDGACESVFLPTTQEYACIRDTFEEGEAEVLVTLLSACGQRKLLPLLRRGE